MDLYNDYIKFCEYMNSVHDSHIDLSDEVFFRPTTLLPLYSFIISKKLQIIMPTNKNTKNYLTTIMTRQLDNVFSTNRTYLPFVQFPISQGDVNRILDYLYMIQNINDYGGENAFKYLIGEIVDNIYQHSEFRKAYALAQAYKKMGYMDVCFIDDGITINGCFQKHNIVSFNDVEAIDEATKGLSTKGEERGTGLESSAKIITNGLIGSFLIVSGKGALNIERDGKNMIPLNDFCKFNGTLVIIRIPYRKETIDIFDYL